MNQIFKELGAMVHEQGEVVDSIEASVEKTEVFVGEGVQQLREASNYQVNYFLIKLKFTNFILGWSINFLLKYLKNIFSSYIKELS